MHMIKRDSKKGQEVIGMSISTILSIFIIIVIIAIAIYTIIHFLNINKCTNVGFFYESLQDEVNKARASGRYNDVFEKEIVSSGALKTSVEFVCFGNLTAIAGGDDITRRQSFNYGNSYNRNANVFMYPGEKTCQGLASKKIEHVKIVGPNGIERFFCLDVKALNGKIRVKLEKEVRDNLVRLSET